MPVKTPSHWIPSGINASPRMARDRLLAIWPAMYSCGGNGDAQAGEIRLIALPPVFAHGEQLFKQRGHRPQQACRLFLKRWLPVRVTDGVARARRRQVQEPPGHEVKAGAQQHRGQQA